MATKSVARSAIGFAQICRQYNKKSVILIIDYA